ncbi:MAG: LptF/LptG family permease [Candidatus Sumerlaeaceae bacterium]|nr:LptF/LptG family permease [Candidatus Sumerlaeaceae bacterium]
MKILQKYVLRELLSPLGLGLLVFTFVFLVGQLFRLTDLLLNRGVSGFLVIELIATMLPGILSVTVPMALLVAVLLGVGRLSADREILAIRMSGVNLFHIVLPILIMAAGLSCVMTWANFSLVPYLNLKLADLATQIEFNVLSNIPPNRIWDLSGSKEESNVFFYEARDPKTDEMRGVNIKTEMAHEDTEAERNAKINLRLKVAKLKESNDPAARQELLQIRDEYQKLENKTSPNEVFIVAHSGRILADISQRLITINLTSGSIHMVNPDRPSAYNIVHFETFTKGERPRLEKAEDGELKKSPKEMSVAELRQNRVEVPEFPKKLREYNRMGVELYQRFSIPLACIAFALIAIPLAVYVRPTGKAVAFAMAFLLIFVYYGLLNYGSTLGNMGNKFGPVAIFLPNVLLSGVGSFLLYRMVMK